MRISGHKSERLLKSYSCVQGKRIISDTLSLAGLTQTCQMTTSTSADEDLRTILNNLENSETFRSSFFDSVAEFDNNNMDSNPQYSGKAKDLLTSVQPSVIVKLQLIITTIIMRLRPCSHVSGIVYPILSEGRFIG